MSSAEIAIRTAEPGDVEVLHRFILELADAEQFPGEVSAQLAASAEPGESAGDAREPTHPGRRG